MRLLEHADGGGFKLTKDLVGGKIPSYAILSHTWGPDTEEVTFKDLVDGTGKSKVGYGKLDFCAKQAMRDGLRHFWVDTCCIDKSNNSELSEAINSMFRWYQDSARCYVYLSDVSVPNPEQNHAQAGHPWEPHFRDSRWFTRGWTLQELLAPVSVEFFTREGERLGDKLSLGQQIHSITRIPVPALQGTPLSNFEIDERLAWAATRQTTREEDWAYCLLGIFGIFMPLIYGEGREHAISRLKKEISSTTKRQGISGSSAIHDWLEAPDPSVEYNSALKKRHPATGLWLIEGPSFASWLEHPNSFLWLNGFAGCGKSVLCSTAIQYVLRLQASRPRVGVAYFFFAFDDVSKQDTSAMLRSLALQLSSQLEESEDILSRLHENYRKTVPPDHALVDCLHQLTQKFDHVYIFLDALDESPRDTHREDVLQALVDLRAWSEPRLHLLVTSRNETDIHDVLRNDLGVSKSEIIPMRNESVDRDIAAFTAQHLKDNRRLRKWRDYHGRIEAKFAERAKGVFRWVECQFKALEQCPQSKHLLDQLLESLPKSLDQTYERMLLKIDPDWMEYSKSMLMLLCCAKRPLTVPELVDAVAVELGDTPIFDPGRRLETVDAIHEVCPGFIEVDEQPSGRASTVRIAHFSVQEYLESERILRHEAAKFSVQKREAHTDIACICLTYLLEPLLLTSMNRKREYPLALYAAKTWHEHLREGEDGRINLVQDQTLQLFQHPEKFENWVDIWNVDDYYYGQKPTENVPSPIYYASLLGLDLLLSELLDGDTTNNSISGPEAGSCSAAVNSQEGEYGNALQAASARGHHTIVQLLLEKDADVNAQGGYYGNALQAASAGGHKKVAQLLLVGNAEVNAQGGEYGNALYAASVQGHEPIVQLLLDRNADVNAEGGEYGNALYAASAGGHEGIVKLLLEKENINVNAQSRGYGTALYAASVRGHVAIVRLLLGKKADVNAQGGEYGNALYAASARGYEEIVRLLLEKKANIRTHGFYGGAIHAASAGGYEEIVRLLQAGFSIIDDVDVATAGHGENHVTRDVPRHAKRPTGQLQPTSVSKTAKKQVSEPGSRANKKGGRGIGAVGLSNLGNTGYINSTLQCMRSVEELSKYFLVGEYTKDINENNPLGYGGKVAIAYGKLLSDIYNTSNDSIRPSDFRSTLGSCVPWFASKQQQDSREFLGFLLDALQEDLSRIKKKPYIEKPQLTDEMVQDKAAIARMADEIWDIHKKRHDSAIMDLFTGLYKCTLTCQVCDKVNITFDPFEFLTLPLPKRMPWVHTVKFYPLNDCPVGIEVEVPQHSSFGVLKQFVSGRTGVSVERLVGVEEFRWKLYKLYDENINVSEEIHPNDILAFHEVEAKPSNWPLRPDFWNNLKQTMRSEITGSDEAGFENALYSHMAVPVLHRRSNKRVFPNEDNGLPPHFIMLNREEARHEDAIRRKILEKVATFTTWNGLKDDDRDTAKITQVLDAVPVSPGPSDSAHSPASPLQMFYQRRPRWVDMNEVLDPKLKNMFALGYFADDNPGSQGIPTGWSTVQDLNVLPLLSDRICGPVHPIVPGRVAGTTHDYGLNPIVRLGEGIVVDWTESAWDILFAPDSAGEADCGTKTYLALPKLRDPILEQQRKSRSASDVSIYDCLDEFERSLILSEEDKWYCPRCKEYRRACSKLDIWKTPDVLICNLKRLDSNSHHPHKIGTRVDFPLEDLNIEKRVLKKEDGKAEVYDLIGVVDHLGRGDGGHNMTSAKNFVDGTWYHYDDSIVEVVKDPSAVVTAAAYIVFYRRRSAQPLGGSRFKRISKVYARRDSDTGSADDSDDGQGGGECSRE